MRKNMMLWILAVVLLAVPVLSFTPAPTNLAQWTNIRPPDAIYNFDNSTNTSGAFDMLNNYSKATFSGTSQISPSMNAGFGNSANFLAGGTHGSSDGYLDFAFSPPNTMTNLSYCFWVMKESGTYQHYIFFIGANGDTSNYHSLTGAEGFFSHFGTDEWTTTSTSSILTDGVPELLCFTRDVGGNAVFYRNNTAFITKAVTPKTWAGTGRLNSRTWTPTDYQPISKYDDFMWWWNYSLTATDVANIYAGNYTINNLNQIYFTSESNPSDLYNTTSTSMNFNVTINSSQNYNCSLLIDNVIDQSQTDISNTTDIINFTKTGLSNGLHNYTINCSTIGLSNVTSVKRFFVDSTEPQITWNIPSLVTWINTATYTINASVNDTYLDATNLSVYNAGSSLIYNNFTTSVTPLFYQVDTIPFTSDGNYTLELCARDSATYSPLMPYYDAKVYPYSIEFFDADSKNNITMTISIYNSLGSFYDIGIKNISLGKYYDTKHIYYGGIGYFNVGDTARFTYHSNNKNIKFIEKNLLPAHFVTSDYRLYFHHKDLTDKGWIIADKGITKDGDYYVDFMQGKAGTLDFDPVTGGLHNVCSNSSIVVVDRTAPQYSLNNSITTATFSPSYINHFNITISDNYTSSVLIEHNFTGTLVNYSMSKTGSVYYYNSNTLKANHYTWKYHMNDTLGNSNVTESWSFTISKASTMTNLTLNSAESNLNIVYPQTTTAVTWTSAGSVTLYRNGTDITSENNTAIILGAGYYNYTAVNTGNANYTGSSKAYDVNVSINTTSCSLSFDMASPQDYLTSLTATCSCILYRNNTDVNSENGNPVTLGVNHYLYVCNQTGTANYTSSTNSSAFSINKIAPVMTLASDDGWTYDYTTSTNEVECTSNTAQVTPSVYRDGSLRSNPETFTLGAGTYEYVCNNTPTQNYTTDSDSDTLTINKASTSVSLTLNGVANDVSIAYPNPMTAVYSTDYGSAVMYRNGTDKSSESGVAVYLSAGYYNYTAVNTGNANYTGSSITRTATITQASSTCTLGFDKASPQPYGNAVNVSCSCNYGSYNLYDNGTEINARNNIPYNYSVGTHSFVCNNTGNINYTSDSDSSDYEITLAIPVCTGLGNIDHSGDALNTPYRVDIGCTSLYNMTQFNYSCTDSYNYSNVSIDIPVFSFNNYTTNSTQTCTYAYCDTYTCDSGTQVITYIPYINPFTYFHPVGQGCLLDKTLPYQTGYGLMIFLLLVIFMFNIAYMKIPAFNIVVGIAFIITTLNFYACTWTIGATCTIFGLAIIMYEIIVAIKGRNPYY